MDISLRWTHNAGPKGVHLKGSALINIRQKALSPLMIFLHKVELFSISHLDDISSWKSFMNVQVSSNLKEKKIDMKGKMI